MTVLVYDNNSPNIIDLNNESKHSDKKDDVIKEYEEEEDGDGEEDLK